MTILQVTTMKNLGKLKHDFFFTCLLEQHAKICVGRQS